MGTFLNAMKANTNYTYTANGALAHETTNSALYDMFALGGAYRSRSEDDCIFLFKKAYEENPTYALKCLFYLRDVLQGQGERRFFRVCMKWLAKTDREAAARNLQYVAEYGRYDDFYLFVGTPLESQMFNLLKSQLALDVQSKTPSLLAKWLKSCNTSSADSRVLGEKTRRAFGMTARQYRKTLSILRERIKVVEKLMSANRWNEIQFDKIPSKAGLIYKNAFARRDMIKAKYEAFATDKNTKVNAKSLYPYEVVQKALSYKDATDREVVNKYWDNLTDYFKGASLNALAMVDTSASMRGTPLNIAISLGLYCADKAKGPFAGHYVSFSSRPQLISTNGTDFCDKVQRIYRTNLCENTNLIAAFDMLLNVAVNNNMKQEDLPKKLIVISDMQIDYGARNFKVTEMETLRQKWAVYGYQMPELIYWNANASKDTILDAGPGVTYVSGCSPVLFQQIMADKNGEALMYDKLNSQRYANIH